MKKACSVAFITTLAFSQIGSGSLAVAQALPPNQPMTVTLYSPETHKLANAPRLPSGRERPDASRMYFSFTSGKLATSRSWDLSYGTIGGWFVVGFGIDDDRSTIKDLGELGWNDKFNVPALSPLTELRPGEARYIVARAKTPARGLPSDIRGVPSAGDQYIDLPTPLGVPSRDRDIDQMSLSPSSSVPRSLRAQTNNGETSITVGSKDAKRSKPAPVLAKVDLNHLYVIHVIKGQSDFYVLVHVDALVASDNCTISWKRIPPP
ncbi:MAG TPA: hypothetical protein VK557_07475 [Pyrinomonadaceae bacterium]|nr:hypothetical protein [Pyrinomonadaceae bacterium]